MISMPDEIFFQAWRIKIDMLAPFHRTLKVLGKWEQTNELSQCEGNTNTSLLLSTTKKYLK
jgi:hypothetical protein